MRASVPRSPWCNLSAFFLNDAPPLPPRRRLSCGCRRYRCNCAVRALAPQVCPSKHHCITIRCHLNAASLLRCSNRPVPSLSPYADSPPFQNEACASSCQYRWASSARGGRKSQSIQHVRPRISLEQEGTSGKSVANSNKTSCIAVCAGCFCVQLFLSRAHSREKTKRRCTLKCVYTPS